MTQAQIIALHQPCLRQIALRLVKCKADAEDIVQDTFLKWLSIDTTHIADTKAYLVRTVTNNCFNHLKLIKNKKEDFLDTMDWSEVVSKRFKELDFSSLDLHIDLQAALSIIQHKLEPLERAVYLLREVFNFDYDSLQEVLERKKDHCRQLFSRAKVKLSQEAQRISSELPSCPKWVEKFKSACESGVSNELVQVLREDIRLAF